MIEALRTTKGGPGGPPLSPTMEPAGYQVPFGFVVERVIVAPLRW